MAEDVLTKGVLTEWLVDLPDETNIALEINEFGQLDFIAMAPDGQDRVLRIGVLGSAEGEEIN